MHFSWGFGSAGDLVKIDLEMVAKYVPSFVMPNNTDNIQ